MGGSPAPNQVWEDLMSDRESIWIYRARRVDAHWQGGFSVLGDDRMRDPEPFRTAVRRVAEPVLHQMVDDEVTLRSLRSGRGIDAGGIVRDVLDRVLPGLDPGDGVRLAVVKLQLAALEAIDEGFRDDVLLDHPEVVDREFTDDKGVVGFL